MHGHPIKIPKIDLLDFSPEDRISGTIPSFIHEENIKRADSGDPAARNYRGKTLRVAIRAFLFRAPPEIHVKAGRRWISRKGKGHVVDGEKLETRRNWAFEESCESQPVLLLTLGWNIRVRACPIQISAGPSDFRAPWISTCEPRFPEGQGSTYLPLFGLLKLDDSFFLSDPPPLFFLKEFFYKWNSFVETNVFYSRSVFLFTWFFFWWIERNARDLTKRFLLFFFLLA